MIFVRIESTVLNLRFYEKKAACVWMLFLYVNVILGYIGNAENAVLDNIVFPSGCHRVLIFIAPAYSRVRYRSPNFCPSVRPSVRPSTFTSKFGFLDIRDSCESENLHSNCP